MLTLGFGFWEYWQLYHKVTFDGPNKLILVNDGVTDLNVQIDIYSDWKEWAQIEDNLKYEQALTAIGGDPITATTNVGITYFLENGWRMKAAEGNYVLSVSGNLFTREPGDDPFVPVDGKESKVTINLVRSNLVDLIQSQLGATESTQLDELHKLSGLDADNPLVVGSTQRTAGASIDQDISGTDPVTVTRQP